MPGAVIANGQVVVSDQVKIIQHRDGGILLQIMVENGHGQSKFRYRRAIIGIKIWRCARRWLSEALVHR